MAAVSENGAVKNGDDAEMGHVKFIKNGDNIDVNAKTKLMGSLTKEQLEKYRDDPFFRRLRYILFSAFWLTWVALFGGAVLLVLLSPKCAKKDEDVKLKWFQTAINYQIYTPSFYDSDGDGVGDLRGITAKLDRLRRIGVTSIRPTPILTTIKDYFKPSHVQDVLAVDERFGTPEDVRALVEAAHNNDMHVIVDLPLTVDPHAPHAKAKLSAKESQSKEHAALLDIANATNVERLVEAARNMLRWGVDAIQITDYGLVKKSSQTKSLDPLIAKIREIAETDDTIREKEPVIILEWAWHSAATLGDAYVRPLTTQDSAPLLAQLAASVEDAAQFYSSAAQIHSPPSAPAVQGNASHPIKAIPIWTYADLATPRLDQQIDLDPILDQHSNETMAALSMVQLFLPGPISIYYGEEYGLGSVRTTATRFPQRGIMRWDGEATRHAGFTTLGVNDDVFFGDLEGSPFIHRNVAFEQQFSNSHSQLRMFKRVAELRSRSWVLKGGAFVQTIDDGLHVYARVADTTQPDKSEAFVLAVNWPKDGRVEARPLRRETLQRLVGAGRLPTSAEVKATTPNAASVTRLANSPTALTLAPFQAVLLRFP